MAPFAEHPSITGVLLDVTNQEQIDAVIRTIETNHPEEGLYAVVNNAGYNPTAPPTGVAWNTSKRTWTSTTWAPFA